MGGVFAALPRVWVDGSLLHVPCSVSDTASRRVYMWLKESRDAVSDVFIGGLILHCCWLIELGHLSVKRIT